MTSTSTWVLQEALSETCIEKSPAFTQKKSSTTSAKMSTSPGALSAKRPSTWWWSQTSCAWSCSSINRLQSWQRTQNTILRRECCVTACELSFKSTGLFTIVRITLSYLNMVMDFKLSLQQLSNLLVPTGSRLLPTSTRRKHVHTRFTWIACPKSARWLRSHWCIAASASIKRSSTANWKNSLEASSALCKTWSMNKLIIGTFSRRSSTYTWRSTTKRSTQPLRTSGERKETRKHGCSWCTNRLAWLSSMKLISLGNVRHRFRLLRLQCSLLATRILSSSPLYCRGQLNLSMESTLFRRHMTLVLTASNKTVRFLQNLRRISVRTYTLHFKALEIEFSSI